MTEFEHLSNYFKPTNYNLTLDIDRVNRTFVGNIKISGNTKTDSKIVKLHANYLTISSVKLDDQPIDFEYQDNILSFTNLTDGLVEIDYSGQISDQMNGIYPCYYRHDDQEMEIIATQFESHYAREVFPHIDEPIAKATFDLTLITEKGKTVLSNTEIKEQTESDNKLKTIFKTTPLMSSYTFAFVIGDFIKKTAISKNGTIVNTYTTIVHQQNELEFASEIAVKALDFYEDFLGVKFPLPKCDHVALPDFAAGAMENWGLITYRESMFLSTEVSSLSTKKSVALVIAHELAHMWFGNLVTMKWWDELWLNESLASIMEYFAVDYIKPEYQVWHDFYNHSYVYAMNRDSIKGVQSVMTPVNHPDEISTVFDGAIIYAKGACGMLMLKNWVGEAVFKKSLNSYLQKFAHQNPSSDDFLAEFAKNTDKPVEKFMNQFISQSGLPLVKVSQQNNQITVSQQAFLKDDNQWLVPLFLPESDQILDQKSINLDKLTVLNQNIQGYYLTDYDQKLKPEILKIISQKADLNSFYYLNNQILLAKNQYISSEQLVDDFMAFYQKDDLMTWRSLNKIAGSIIFLIKKTPEEELFKNILNQSALPKILAKIGYQTKATDDLETIELRNIAFSLLSYAQNQQLIQYCIDLFDQTNIDQLEHIDAEIRSYVIANKLRYDFNSTDFDKVLQLHHHTQNPNFKSDLRVALTDIKDLDAGKQILSIMNDQKIVKPQDLVIWFIYMLRSREQKEQTWRWLKANFKRIRQMFSENKDYADFVNYSAAVFYTESGKQKFVELFDQYKDDLALARIYQIGLNSIDDKIKLHTNQSKIVREKVRGLK